MSDQTLTLDSPPPLSDQLHATPLDSAAAADPQPPLSRNSSFSKLNAQAPEFVPMKTHSNSVAVIDPPPPIVRVYPNAPFLAPVQGVPHVAHVHHHHKKHHHGEQESAGQSQLDKDHHGLSDESTQKLINQVEFYFSDVNLATTDHLIKFINKDREGYVPMSVVSSFKKIKALISSNAQLAAVLRKSTKLVVSDDGKKVKRLHPLTGPDMEDLKARIIVAENLPEDHCHQNLMRIFSTVGSVKSIRTCLPQPSSNGASSASRSSKNDNMLSSNKAHAFVEYESVELAEKAITELNDEDDWRTGLKVRLLHKRGSKSAPVQAKKAGNEGEATCEEEDTSTSEHNQGDKHAQDPSGQADIQSHENGDELGVVEREGGQKKGRHRGRGKGRGKGQHYHHGNRANQVGSTPTTTNNAMNGEQATIAKQVPPGPRMPDGTRGFSMGRGKAVTINSAA